MTIRQPLEYRARDLATKLRGSGVPENFLVAAARRALESGDPLRDSRIIADARGIQKAVEAAYARNAARRGGTA